MTGADLRRRRQELGLSQERLAALLGVTWSTVQRWEARAEVPNSALRDSELRDLEIAAKLA